MAKVPTGRPRGRPKGSIQKRSRDAQEKARELGCTPLEVMLWAMHRFKDADNHAEAAKVASMAAPYVHARLTSVQQVQQVTVRVISSDDMIGEATVADAALTAATDSPFVQ